MLSNSVMISRHSTVGSPHALPLGKPQPPHSSHAVSASLPTWESVVGYGTHKERILRQMQNGYPRFFVHPIIQNLGRDVLTRFNLIDRGVGCMLLPTKGAADRCFASLNAIDTTNAAIDRVNFALSKLSPSTERGDIRWLAFHAVLYPEDISQHAAAFWRDTGDGITSRHAKYCHEWLQFLDSESENPVLQTRAAQSASMSVRSSQLMIRSALQEEVDIKTFIAKLASSDQSGQPAVASTDVFLYPTGMSAISAMARALATFSESPDAVAYGFVYAETNKVIPRCGFSRYSFYGRGSLRELEELEEELAAGRRIQMFFCDFPGNPQLTSPDLHRIRGLADRYQFMVVCDDTVATFVNVDLLPYVDILITSLTKMFSGGSDVMGGSVVVNPKSPYHQEVTSSLARMHEEANFPFDVMTLAKNCSDLVPRVHRCNSSTLAVISLLSAHPSIQEVYHPSMTTRSTYERYRRTTGGYGNLLSIIFREPCSAVLFYDALDVCKGTSFGTNFTLAVPFIQLYPVEEQEWIASYGIPKHLIRLSVGLEDEVEIVSRVNAALRKVEGYEDARSDGCPLGPAVAKL